MLATYDYSVNTDALSRLPLPHTIQNTPIPAEIVHLIEHFNSSPITVSEIRYHTSRDPLLSRVATVVNHRWVNEEVSDEWIPYAIRKDQLSGRLHTVGI